MLLMTSPFEFLKIETFFLRFKRQIKNRKCTTDITCTKERVSLLEHVNLLMKITKSKKNGGEAFSALFKKVPTPPNLTSFIRDQNNEKGMKAKELGLFEGGFGGERKGDVTLRLASGQKGRERERERSVEKLDTKR